MTNNDRVTVEFNDGEGEVTDCWTIKIDNKERFNIYIKHEINRIYDNEKIISFVFNPLFNGTHSHSLSLKPQNGIFKVVKTERQ